MNKTANEKEKGTDKAQDKMRMAFACLVGRAEPVRRTIPVSQRVSLRAYRIASYHHGRYYNHFAVYSSYYFYVATSSSDIF